MIRNWKNLTHAEWKVFIACLINMGQHIQPTVESDWYTNPPQYCPKGKGVKVARRGLYSTAALYIAYCALVPNGVCSSFLHLVPLVVSRGATTPNGAGALY
jgi:hypothetical protein